MRKGFTYHRNVMGGSIPKKGGSAESVTDRPNEKKAEGEQRQ